MALYWHKERWWPSDRHPLTREILPGAMPLGIYCEDEAALRILLRSAPQKAIGLVADCYGKVGHRFDGVPVFVATPEQAALFESIPSTDPETALAQRAAEFWEMTAKVNRLIGKAARREPPPAPPVPGDEPRGAAGRQGTQEEGRMLMAAYLTLKTGPNGVAGDLPLTIVLFAQCIFDGVIIGLVLAQRRARA
jgi:hypothetical protein